MEDEIDYDEGVNLFRELVRVLPMAKPDHYFKLGKWLIDELITDHGLVVGHRREAGSIDDTVALEDVVLPEMPTPAGGIPAPPQAPPPPLSQVGQSSKAGSLSKVGQTPKSGSLRSGQMVLGSQVQGVGQPPPPPNAKTPPSPPGACAATSRNALASRQGGLAKAANLPTPARMATKPRQLPSMPPAPPAAPPPPAPAASPAPPAKGGGVSMASSRVASAAPAPPRPPAAPANTVRHVGTQSRGPGRTVQQVPQQSQAKVLTKAPGKAAGSKPAPTNVSALKRKTVGTHEDEPKAKRFEEPGAMISSLLAGL